jgi:thioesterase domain-containing protein
MIPSFYIELETFPINPNGKVDHAALAAMDVLPTSKETSFIAPNTDLEKRLKGIWEDLLNVQPIGLRDNFFTLGGHSLLAVRLFSRIESELAIKLPLAPFFESPTIESQARSIEDHELEVGATIVAVEAQGEKPPFFCISPTVIDVMTYIELSKHMGKDQPFYALYSPILGQWRTGANQRKAIALQFIEKIREISPQGPYLIGGYSAGGIVALEVAQEMERMSLDVALLVLFDTFGPTPPKRLPWVTPWLFNLLLLVRRVESYLWKFWILDWKDKLDYLRISKVRSWISDRYLEVGKMDERELLEETHHFLEDSTYAPESYDGNVLLIRANKGLLGVEYDPKLGWGETFTGNFEICTVPGDHEAILFGPRSQHVAEQLKNYFDKWIGR